MQLLPRELSAHQRYVLARAASRLIDFHNYRLIWSFWDGAPIIVVVSSKIEMDGRRYTPEGELCAVALLPGILQTLYGRQRVKVVQDLAVVEDSEPGSAEEDANIRKHVGEAHLICLGGPHGNRVTSWLWGKQELPYVWTPTGKLCVRNTGAPDGGILLSPDALPSAGVPARDFGLVIKTTNPASDHRIAFILAGIHTYGTLGTVQAIVDSAVARSIVKKRHGGLFDCVVECYWEEGAHPWPTYVSVYLRDSN